jgi:hypothetical protein
MMQRRLNNFPGSSEAVLEVPEVSSILFAPTVPTLYENPTRYEHIYAVNDVDKKCFMQYET